MQACHDVAVMSEPWRQRLRDTLERSGKSMRAVSLASGAAAGYLHGVLEGGKEPTVDKLLAVCDSIPVSPLWVILGIDAEPDDVAILRALHEKPDARQGILTILAATAKA